jgi:hypothetical protein
MMPLPAVPTLYEDSTMNRVALAASLLMLSPMAVQAAETVTFEMKASMPSLRDPARKDTFAVVLTDKQVSTSLNITCQAGKSGLLTRTDEACAVAGTGALINPQNAQKLPRAQYAGGWVVKPDGFTEGNTMSVNYLAVGKVAASAGAFGGSMILKPENPSSSGQALKDLILKNIKGKATGLIDERVDTIQLQSFAIPSAGMPSDKGCTWTGTFAYSYQTESWFIDVMAKCNGKDFPLKGNMPLTKTAGVANQSQYDLTVTLPAADAVGDEALFMTPTADTDLFAAADGISGQIILKESGYVDTKVDDVMTKVASEIDASGTLNGEKVPVEVVRSLGTLIGVLSRTFFGA